MKMKCMNILTILLLLTVITLMKTMMMSTGSATSNARCTLASYPTVTPPWGRRRARAFRWTVCGPRTMPYRYRSWYHLRRRRRRRRLILVVVVVIVRFRHALFHNRTHFQIRTHWYCTTTTTTTTITITIMIMMMFMIQPRNSNNSRSTMLSFTLCTVNRIAATRLGTTRGRPGGSVPSPHSAPSSESFSGTSYCSTLTRAASINAIPILLLLIKKKAKKNKCCRRGLYLRLLPLLLLSLLVLLLLRLLLRLRFRPHPPSYHYH